MTRLSQVVVLPNGQDVPKLAYGTASKVYQKPCAEKVLNALKSGWRHIDTAQDYGNESSIGQALQLWDGDRKDVYITTKWGLEHGVSNPRTHILQALEELGTDYIDQYLFHYPLWESDLTLEEAWKEMELLVTDGLTRSIGISNFKPEHIERLAKVWTIKPSIHQIEHHPYCAHSTLDVALVELSEKYGIPISGYAPLVPLRPGIEDPLDLTLEQICVKRGLTKAQILILWSAQTCPGPIVTSTTRIDRMEEFLKVFEVDMLDQEDVEAITQAGRGRDYRRWG